MTNTPTPRSIAIKMRSVIAEQTQVTYEYLMERGKKHYDTQTMVQAFRVLHTFKDIRKVVKNEEVYYSLAGLRKASTGIHDNTDFIRMRDKAVKEWEDEWGDEPEPFPDLCAFVTVGNSLVPESNKEHYEKVLGKSARDKKKYFKSIQS